MSLKLSVPTKQAKKISYTRSENKVLRLIKKTRLLKSLADYNVITFKVLRHCLMPGLKSIVRLLLFENGVLSQLISLLRIRRSRMEQGPVNMEADKAAIFLRISLLPCEIYWDNFCTNFSHT